MPRYMVQRNFPEGLHIPVANGGADMCAAVVERNAEEGVTWLHSYVSADKLVGRGSWGPPRVGASCARAR